MPNYFYDANHVRYELVSTCEGKPYNWLFIPGGPGCDSRYFHSLVELLELPGNVWLVDFPGNGSNRESVTADYNYDSWFDLFLPTIRKFQNPILVGHSFGGMLPLFFPQLEQELAGFVILNSAPSLWLAEAAFYAKQFQLPDLTEDMQEFTKTPNDATFKRALDACMPYYFPAHSLETGRALLADVPFNFIPAVWAQRKVLELDFGTIWVPQEVPTLIVGATHDCICPYYLFSNDARFKRSNIEILRVEKGGHMPWIEHPEIIQEAFKRFCQQL